MSVRLVITGVCGMLGSALARVGRAAGLQVIGFSRADLDVTARDRVRLILSETRPDAVVNLAAFNAVDRAEEEEASAFSVNRDGAANVAAAACEAGTRLIHISTDYVFDGRTRRPYLPSDPARPINVYGRSKWLGEEAVRAALDDHIVLRTSWMFAPWGTNFVRTIARLASERDEVRVVVDQWGRPTSALDLAEAILVLVRRQELRGTFHFANAGVTTWYDFATAVVSGLRERGATAQVVPVTTEEYGARATRPLYSVLDTEAFTAATGIAPRSWQSALADTLAALN